jgi:transposase
MITFARSLLPIGDIMNKEQELRGDIRELLSQTLVQIAALERSNADKFLIDGEKFHANYYRQLLNSMNKGE